MKRRVLLGLLVISALVLAELTRTPATPITVSPLTSPLHATPGRIYRWRLAAQVSLTCQEYANQDLSWQNWRNAPLGPLSAVVRPWGLVADGDLLWIVSRYGLLRLDTRVWECVLFAGDRLGMAYPFLPDGEGGLWVGSGQELWRFSGGQWRVALATPQGLRTTKLGLDWDGYLHAQLSDGPTSVVLDADTLTIVGDGYVGTRLDITDCARWQRASGWSETPRKRYDYVTRAGCEEIARLASQHLTSGALVAVSAEGEETWIVQRPWQLTRQRGDIIDLVDLPYRGVVALTLGRDAWMVTEDGLVRVQTETPVQDGAISTFILQPFSLSTEAFPGDVRSLVQDQDGAVWTINGYGALRYDELERNWNRVISATRSADAIVADPDQGVWIAGQGELLRAALERRQSWPLPDVITGTPTALVFGAGRRLWLGTLQDGVWTTPVPPMTEAWDEPVALDWRQFDSRHGLADELITVLSYGPDGRIYAGHHAGVSIFDPADGVEDGRWSTLPGSDAPDGKGWVNALAWSGEQLWVGYFNDLALRRYVDGNWTDYEWPEERLGIGALLVDDDGALWVGTTEGLWRWLAAREGGAPLWEPLNPDSIVVRETLALLQDAQGRIWAGGREGVALLEESAGE